MLHACEAAEPFIITKLMECTLQFSLHGSDPSARPPISLLLAMSIQIVEGVAYLHNCRPPILHRDLKSANILLNGHFDCKISDFGLSRLMQHEASMSTVAGVSAKAVAGTPVYMPPGHCWRIQRLPLPLRAICTVWVSCFGNYGRARCHGMVDLFRRSYEGADVAARCTNACNRSKQFCGR